MDMKGELDFQKK